MVKRIALIFSLVMVFLLLVPACSEKGNTINGSSSSNDPGTGSVPSEICAHDWVAGKSTATCEEAGTITYECSKCHESKTEDMAALGHNFSSDWTIDVVATCTTEGSISHHCVNCDAKKDVTPLLPSHNYSNEWTTDLEATCSTEGSKSHHCMNCDAKKDITTIPVCDHSYSNEWTTDLEATCSTEGSKSHHCINCDAKKDITTIPVCDHSYSNEWTIDIEATCVKEGSKSHHCMNCEAKKDVTSTPLASHDLVTETVEASCVTIGMISTTCKNCDYKQEEVISALGHTWDLVVPTCTQGQECTICHAHGNPEAGHTFVDHAVLPNCTQDGYTLHECANCDYSYKDTIVAALGHNVMVWNENIEKSTVDVENPCLNYVAYDGECMGCHDTISRIEDLERHSYTGAITTFATCSANGEMTYTCSKCQKNYKDDYVDEDAHSWNEGVLGENGITTYTCTHNETHTKTLLSFKEDITANVSKESLQSASSIELKEATLDLDPAALETLGDNFSLSADTLTDTQKDELNLTEEQKNQIKDNKIYNFSMNQGSADFGTGKVTISVPYELAEGEDPDCIAIWYINEDGSVETIQAKYSNGFAIFETNHFSYYTVTRLSQQERCALYGHQYKDTIIAATCLSGGYTYSVCSRCGHIEISDRTNALGHQIVELTDELVAPTCTNPGMKKFGCSHEGCSYHYEEDIAALGHNYTPDEATVVSATCQHGGQITYICSNCKDSYTTKTAQLKHQIKDEVIAPTCTNNGYTNHNCVTCDYKYIDSFKSATGHSFVDEVVAETCTVDGYTLHHCIHCDESEKINIVEAHHTWNVEQPTCGLDQVCMICQAAGAPATGNHAMSNGVCSVCGHGCEHDYDIKEVPATCTEDGYTLKTCTKCGVITKSDFVKAAGHIGDFECETCHELLVSEDYFNTFLNSFDMDEVTVVLRDGYFTIPSGDQSVETKFKLVEFYMSFDENRKIIGEGDIEFTQGMAGEDTVSGKAHIVLTADALYIVLEDKSLFTELTYDMEDKYSTGPYQFRSSRDSLSYIKMNRKEFDGFENQTSELNFILMVLEDIKKEIIPMIENVFVVNNKTVNSALKSAISKLFNLTIEKDKYLLKVNGESLKELNSTLYTMTLAEFVDAICGENTYVKLKTLLPLLLNKTVKDILTALSEFGINIEDIIALVDKYLGLLMKEGASIDALLGPVFKLTEGQTVMQFLTSETISAMKISEFIATYFGISDTTEIQNTVLQYLTTFESMTLYQIVGSMAGYDEQQITEMKKMLDQMMDMSSDLIHFTLVTKETGEFDSLVLDISKIKSDMFSLAGTIEIHAKNALQQSSPNLAEKVNSYFNQIEVNENNIQDIITELSRLYANSSPDTSYTYDESTNTYNVHITSHQQYADNMYFDGKYNIKEYTTADSVYDFAISIDEINQLTIDCGNWVLLQLSIPYQCSYSYKRIIEKYLNGQLADTPEIFEEKNESYTSSTYFSLCYNMKTKAIVAKDTMHQYKEDVANSVMPEGCNKVGKAVFSCSDCGAIQIEYYVNGHKNVEYTYDFMTESHNCEDGVIIHRYCKDCDSNLEDRTIYYHETLETLIDLKEYGYYGEGGLTLATCPCGEEVWASMKLDSANPVKFLNDYTDEDGNIHRGITVFRADDFCYRVESIFKPIEQCLYEVSTRYLLGYDVKTQEFQKEYFIKSFKEQSQHLHMEEKVEFLPGSKICTEGVLVSYVCKDCGFIQDQYNDYIHRQVEEIINLSDFGSDCGGEYIYKHCLCGKNAWVIENSKCDFDYEIMTNYTDESGANHSGVLHTCAVSDPKPCGFNILRETITMPEQGCTRIDYTRILIGYNQEDKSFKKEIIYDYRIITDHHMSRTDKEIQKDGIKGYRVEENCISCNQIRRVEEWYYLLGEDKPSYRTYFSLFEFGCTHETKITYNLNVVPCNSIIEVYREGVLEDTYENCACHYTSVTDQQGSCSQPTITHRYCVVCGTSDQPNQMSPGGHSYEYNPETGIYVCIKCGMQSTVGKDGSIILEDMTEENSDQIVVGYYNRMSKDEFSVVFTLVSKADSETFETLPFEFTNYVREKTIITFSMSDCQQAAMMVAKDLSNYDIRMSLVPLNGSVEMDFGITFGNLVANLEVAA